MVNQVGTPSHDPPDEDSAGSSRKRPNTWNWDYLEESFSKAEKKRRRTELFDEVRLIFNMRLIFNKVLRPPWPATQWKKACSTINYSFSLREVEKTGEDPEKVLRKLKELVQGKTAVTKTF